MSARSTPETDDGGPLSGIGCSSLDGLVGGFPVLPAAAAQGAARGKATIRKLESTVSFLTAELASEVKCKQELIASLARSEEAVAKANEDAKVGLQRQQAKFQAEVAEVRAAMKAAVDSKQAEVGVSPRVSPPVPLAPVAPVVPPPIRHLLFCRGPLRLQGEGGSRGVAV